MPLDTGKLAVAQAAYQAGFPLTQNSFDANGNVAILPADKESPCCWAIAVSFAEVRDHNPAAVNHASGAYGLWQIKKSAHPQLFNGDNWKSPVENARMAKSVYDDAGGFGPWTTFPGEARKHLDDAYDTLRQAGHTGFLGERGLVEVTPGGVVADAVKSVGGWVGELTGWLRDAGIVAGAFVLAIVLLVIGAWVLARQSPTGRKVTDAVEGAATAAVTKGAVK